MKKFTPLFKYALTGWLTAWALLLSASLMGQPPQIWIEPISSQQPRPNNPNLFTLELRTNHVQTKITGQSATTQMDQVFYNPSSHQLQGYFIFPIPQGASIDHFSMFINGQETEGELLSADKAKKIYEGIVRRMQDPALLEYYGNALFRVRIFPIQPKAEQRVKLTYTQTLPKENGTIAYTFPFKHKNETQKAIANASFKIDIESSGSLKTVYCPTHEVEIIRKDDNHATIGFEGSNLKSSNDFKLYYNTDRSKVGVSMLSYNDQTEDGYFFMNVSPGFAEKQQVVEKDITFVLDCSGSMAGDKMDQAKKALNFCVSNLNDGDCFNIIRFSTETDELFSGLQKADTPHRDKAKGYIKKLRAIGGTNIDEALEKALKTPTQKDRPHFIVFLTDGKPTIGETKTEALLKKVQGLNPEQTRIFTFGIGSELNTLLLDKLTKMTQAYRTYVAPEEDIELKVSDFYTKVSSPILTDIEISFDRKVKTKAIHPRKFGDLFKGSTLTFLGRYEGEGKANVTITGKVNGKTERFTYPVEFAKKSTQYGFVPSLWGARAVGYLLDQIRLNGETKELKDEVVRLAKRHGIITPYTSYLIIEDESQLLSSNQIRVEDQLIRNRISNTRESVRQQQNYQESLSESGDQSVEASEEIQEMEYSSNVAAARKKSELLDFKDQTGNNRNLAENITYVQGRAFYQNNNQWMDANVQLNAGQNLNIQRIQFNSQAYFKLIKENDNSREFLALGRNVRFQLGNNIYEVYE